MNQHNQFNPDYVVTVGEILKEEYLEPLGLSVEEFASRIRITVNLANKILNGEEPINLNLAARLGKLFSTTGDYWMNLQMIGEYRQLLQDPDFQEVMDSIKPLDDATI
nr:MAG TPA: addiction module antidote protein [Caudoviricetes sp.]